jgi:hypothetical protein
MCFMNYSHSRTQEIRHHLLNLKVVAVFRIFRLQSPSWVKWSSMQIVTVCSSEMPVSMRLSCPQLRVCQLWTFLVGFEVKFSNVVAIAHMHVTCPAYQIVLNFSGHSSWLQIQRSGFDSRLYQIFWELVGLERGPLSLVSTTEELLDRKVAAPV